MPLFEPGIRPGRKVRRYINRHNPGLGNYWDDLLKKAEDEAKRLAAQAQQVAQQAQQQAQQIAQQAQQVGQQVQQGVQSGMQYVTHLQLPASMRNSPAGQWITAHASPAAIAADLKKLTSPLNKIIAYMSLGNLPGAIMVAKANPDQVMNELPPFARNFVVKLRVELPRAFEGQPSSLAGLGGLDMLGESEYGNGVRGLGFLDGLGDILKDISTRWKKLSTGTKTALITILVVTIILIVIACIYGLGAITPAIFNGGAAGGSAASGGVMVSSLWTTLFGSLLALFKGDPSVPPDVATQPTPTTTTSPGADPNSTNMANQAAQTYQSASFLGGGGTGLILAACAAASILFFPIGVRK